MRQNVSRKGAASTGVVDKEIIGAPCKLEDSPVDPAFNPTLKVPGPVNSTRRERAADKAPVKEECISPRRTPRSSKKAKLNSEEVSEGNKVEEVEHVKSQRGEEPSTLTKSKVREEICKTGKVGRQSGTEGTEYCKSNISETSRKIKEPKDTQMPALKSRTTGLKMFVGAHVSSATGVQKSVPNAEHIGANAFAMFLRSNRTWKRTPLSEESREQFHARCTELGYDATKHILPHGSYLVNLAQEDREKAVQAYDAFRDDIERCRLLGIELFNFHPGFTGTAPRPAAIGRIAAALNKVIKEVDAVVPVLETMAGASNTIGSTFEDIRDIIALIEDKTRIGVCIDTCHIFAAGYDLRTPEAFRKTMDEFGKTIGFQYLRAMHINDSKATFESRRDLHQNIGLGFLGLRAFHNVMNEPRFEGIPLILETPISSKKVDQVTGKEKEVEDKTIWAREIALLESLTGMDVESDEFKRQEKALAAQGAEERAKFIESFQKTQAKKAKAAEKGQTKLNFGNVAQEKKTKKPPKLTPPRESSVDVD